MQNKKERNEDKDGEENTNIPKSQSNKQIQFPYA